MASMIQAVKAALLCIEVLRMLAAVTLELSVVRHLSVITMYRAHLAQLRTRTSTIRIPGQEAEVTLKQILLDTWQLLGVVGASRGLNEEL